MKQGRLKILRYDHNKYKAAYEAWFSEGSLKRATDKLKRDGIVSTHGKPYYASGVRLASTRYIVDNYDEARIMLIETYKKNGYIVEEKFIDRYMIKLAVEILRTPERVKFWLVEHNLLENYKDYISSMIYIPDD